jgi:rhamnosyltransferase subunit B
MFIACKCGKGIKPETKHLGRSTDENKKGLEMRVLIATAGSSGDVLPFVALGNEFKRRGHDVRIYCNPKFEHYAREHDLPFVGVGSAEKHNAFLNSAQSTDPRKGMKMVAEGVINLVPMFYEAMVRDIVPGKTIVIGSTFAFGARLVGEKNGVATAVIHLSPSLFRSEFLAPRLFPKGNMETMPRFIKRMLWRGMDKRFLDPLYTEPFNDYREHLGLKPVRRMMHGWIHDADLCIGMFPEWFAHRQPDWPGNLYATDFPLHEKLDDPPLSSEVSAFLEAGSAPIAFTSGTAKASSHQFFAACIEACKIAGKRGILLTQHPEQLPSTLPEGVAHFRYVPFKRLLPQLAAIVHHGGIGTTSQSMAAGIPQIIRPMAFDQFDNARRAVRLGIAKEILPRHFKADTVARLIQDFVYSGGVKNKCNEIADRLRTSVGVTQTCDTLLQKFGEVEVLAA